MSLKIEIEPRQVLKGIQAVVTGISNRQMSSRFDNSKDVHEFPKILRATVIKDDNNINMGQTFSIKLKKLDNFKIGEIIDFDKIILKNGIAHLWANSKGYVQISLKGDELNAR